MKTTCAAACLLLALIPARAGQVASVPARDFVPIIYQMPVVYQAPVVYFGPVIYQSAVAYASGVDPGAPLCVQPCGASPNVIYIGGGGPGCNYNPCSPIIYFGHLQAARPGYQFTRPR